MKIRVEYSESIQISEGLWRKVGLNPENEPGESLTDDELYQYAKKKVQQWHREAAPGAFVSVNPEYASQLYNGSGIAQQTIQPTIIDRSIERLEILIDDCKTMAELNKVRANNLDKIKSTKSLTDLCEKRFAELINT